MTSHHLIAYLQKIHLLLGKCPAIKQDDIDLAKIGRLQFGKISYPWKNDIGFGIKIQLKRDTKDNTKDNWYEFEITLNCHNIFTIRYVGPTTPETLLRRRTLVLYIGAPNRSVVETIYMELKEECERSIESKLMPVS